MITEEELRERLNKLDDDALARCAFAALDDLDREIAEDELTDLVKRLRRKVAIYLEDARYYRRQWRLCAEFELDTIAENKRRKGDMIDYPFLVDKMFPASMPTASASTATVKERVCRWVHRGDDEPYIPQCPTGHVTYSHDRYCPYCGGKIEIVEEDA